MGLDMYLHARCYVGGWDHSPNDERDLYRSALASIGLPECGESPWLTINATIGYWRKSNHIHRWFIENCAGGTDDCHEINVDRDQLRTLLDLCKQVAALPLVDGEVCNGSRMTATGWARIMEPGKILDQASAEAASRLLPTESGFFFGSTDYDENYISDVQYTVEVLELALSLPERFDITYKASW